MNKYRSSLPLGIPFAAALLFSAVPRATGQPVDIPRGSQIVVVFGSGTDVPEGTRMKAKLLGYDKKGVRFRAGTDRYYVKWEHIRSVNGVRIPAAAAPEADETSAEAPAPRVRPAPRPAPAPPAEPPPAAAAAVGEVDPAPKTPRYERSSSSGGGRPEYGERYGWRDSLDRHSFASPEADEARTQYFVDLDVLLPDGADDGIRDSGQKILAQSGGSATVATDSAVGVRGGVLAPVGGYPGLRWGGSLGFVSGPNSTFSGTFGQGAGQFTDQGTRSVQFWRALVQGEARYKLDERWGLVLGAGLGLAYGTIRESFACAGPGAAQWCSPVSSSDARSYSGFTWEVSPGVTRRFGSFDLLVGLRYAGFPSAGETKTQDKFAWTPLSFNVGARFP